MNEELLRNVEEIGKSFVDVYYRYISSDKSISTLRALYAEGAEIVWNSQPFATADEFCEFVKGMPVFSFKITSITSQPVVISNQLAYASSNERVSGILIVSNGFVSGNGEMTPFSHTFRLVRTEEKGSSAYLVKVDRFCIL